MTEKNCLSYTKENFGFYCLRNDFPLWFRRWNIKDKSIKLLKRLLISYPYIFWHFLLKHQVIDKFILWMKNHYVPVCCIFGCRVQNWDLPACLYSQFKTVNPLDGKLVNPTSLQSKIFFRKKFTTLHRGAFCQFLFRWIYYYGSNKKKRNWQNAPLCIVC